MPGEAARRGTRVEYRRFGSSGGGANDVNRPQPVRASFIVPIFLQRRQLAKAGRASSPSSPAPSSIAAHRCAASPFQASPTTTKAAHTARRPSVSRVDYDASSAQRPRRKDSSSSLRTVSGLEDTKMAGAIVTAHHYRHPGGSSHDPLPNHANRRKQVGAARCNQQSNASYR